MINHKTESQNQMKGFVMKVLVPTTLAGGLLVVSMLCIACGKTDDTAQQSETVQTVDDARKKEKAVSVTSKTVSPEKMNPKKSDNICSSLKTTTPDRLKRLFQNEKELLPVEATSAGVNWGTACRYWEEGKHGVHQIFIKTNATADSFAKTKKESEDKRKEMGIKMTPIDVEDPAFDDLYFTEIKMMGFTQSSINARKGNVQLVTTSRRSREELIQFAKDIIDELK